MPKQRLPLILHTLTSRIGKSVYIALLLTLINSGFAGGTSFSKEKIETICGGHTVLIECGKATPDDIQDGRICVRNTLKFISPNGSVITSSAHKGAPNELNYDKTPIEIECMIGSKGDAYVLVTFSSEKEMYASTIAIELFTNSGKRLTTNSRGLDTLIKKNNLSKGEKLSIEK